MYRLFLLLWISSAAFAGDISGRGVNPYGTTALDELISLSFILGDDSHLRLKLSWKTSENSSQSLTVGKGIAPHKAFIYFWDDSKKTLWFADSETLLRIELANAAEGHTKSTSQGIETYRDLHDFPEDAIPLIQSLLE